MSRSQPLVQLAKPDQQIQTIRTMIDRCEDQFAVALRTDPKAVKAWTRVVMSTVQNPASKLRQCDPLTIVQACMYAAQLDLSVDPLLGEAWLIPRMNRKLSPPRWQANMQIGTKGLLKLALRANSIKGAIKAEVVYEQDFFIYEEKDGEPSITWRPSLSAEPRGHVIGAWAVANFSDGGRIVKVIDREEIERTKARSESGRKDQGPWNTDFEAMSRKTVIRRLCKELPLDPDAARMIARDERTEDRADAFIDTSEVRDVLSQSMAGGQAVDGLDALTAMELEEVQAEDEAQPVDEGAAEG